MGSETGISSWAGGSREEEAPKSASILMLSFSFSKPLRTGKKDESISHTNNKRHQNTHACRFGIPLFSDHAFVFIQPVFSLFHPFALLEVRSECFSTEVLAADWTASRSSLGFLCSWHLSDKRRGEECVMGRDDVWAQINELMSQREALLRHGGLLDKIIIIQPTYIGMG